MFKINIKTNDSWVWHTMISNTQIQPLGMEKYQPLTFDMGKDKDTERYRVGLNSLFLPYSSLFQYS